MKKTIMKKLNAIAQAIYDKKGFNTLSLDMNGISSMTDYVIIAEGNIDRHLKAISTSIRSALEEMGESPLYVEGEQMGDWIVMDYGEVVIHLFVPEFRERYALEELWRKASIVDLKISTHPAEEGTK
jgi:ribosome-associated protein